MSERFLFSSGFRSSHDQHDGYGMKQGLVEASREEVALLAVACIALARQRRVYEGALMAYDQRGTERWCGAVCVYETDDGRGRIVYTVEGDSPPIKNLRETWSWGWQEEKVERYILVDQKTLNDHVWRSATPHTPLLDLRRRRLKRNRIIKWLFLCGFLGLLGVYIYGERMGVDTESGKGIPSSKVELEVTSPVLPSLSDHAVPLPFDVNDFGLPNLLRPVSPLPEVFYDEEIDRIHSEE